MATDTLVKDGKAYASFVELREPKMNLLKGDVLSAVDWFKDEIGVMPRLILLNPKCQHLTDEVPEDITVEVSEMPLAHEILLATVEKVPTEKSWAVKIPHPQRIIEKPEEKEPQKTSAKNGVSIQRPKPIIAPPKTPQGVSHKTSSGGPRGCPGKNFPIEKILALFAEGIKAEDIKAQLESDGIAISRRSLFYIKAGQRQLI